MPNCFLLKNKTLFLFLCWFDISNLMAGRFAKRSFISQNKNAPPGNPKRQSIPVSMEWIDVWTRFDFLSMGHWQEIGMALSPPQNPPLPLFDKDAEILSKFILFGTAPASYQNVFPCGHNYNNSIWSYYLFTTRTAWEHCIAILHSISILTFHYKLCRVRFVFFRI